MSDLISRTEVIQVIERYGTLDGYQDILELIQEIEKLPSIKPMQKRAKRENKDKDYWSGSQGQEDWDKLKAEQERGYWGIYG